MTSNNSFCIVFILLLLGLVQSKQVICKFEDTACMTKAAKNVLKTVFTGIECLLEPTDIIQVKEIEGEIQPCFKYVLSNATMIGLTDCEVTQLIANRERLDFEFGLRCPQLVLSYDFLAKGTLGTVNFNNKGKITVTLDDDLLQFKGKYGSFISKKDHKLRLYVKSFGIDNKLMGNVTIEMKEMVSGDKEISKQAESCVRVNVEKMEKCLRPSVIEAFTKVFIERINIYFKAYPVIDIITVEEC